MSAQVTPLQVPITNGVIRSFGHISSLNIAGFEMSGGFTKVMRKRNRKREAAYSNNVDQIGKTLGKNDYSFQITAYFDWWAVLIQKLIAIGAGYGDQSFTSFVTFGGINLPTYTDTIINCTFDTTEATDDEGTKAVERTIEFNPTKIKFNGLEDSADPLTGTPV
jgi:hypothetical protein